MMEEFAALENTTTRISAAAASSTKIAEATVTTISSTTSDDDDLPHERMAPLGATATSSENESGYILYMHTYNWMILY